MIECQEVLGILGISVNFCGDVKMLKNEFAKVSEFLEKFGFGFEQENCFWFKFELCEF
jgi:hypothetical protein